MDRWAWEALDPCSLFVRACRSARCSACYAARLADGRAQPLVSVFSCATPRSRPVCVGGWPRIRAGGGRRLLRHAHAVEMSREGVPLVVIQRQLGHADLGVTSVYLRGIDNTEIVHAVHERPAPMIPAVNGLRVTH